VNDPLRRESKRERERERERKREKTVNAGGQRTTST